MFWFSVKSSACPRTPGHTIFHALQPHITLGLPLPPPPFLKKYFCTPPQRPVHLLSLICSSSGPSLVVQWLSVKLPMQGVRVSFSEIPMLLHSTNPYWNSCMVRPVRMVIRAHHVTLALYFGLRHPYKSHHSFLEATSYAKIPK